jgi:hypothetical protein
MTTTNGPEERRDAPLDVPLYPHSRRLSVGLAPTASARRAAVARLDRTGR